MVISCQYPHYLYVLNPSSAHQDSKGDWVTNAAWTLIGSCRDETNGRGTLLKSEDMEAFKFSSLVQLPQGSKRVDEGIEVIVANTIIDVDTIDQNLEELKKSGDIRVIGRCMKFDEGQFHNRLWLN